jgi:hypothetical protein
VGETENGKVELDDAFDAASRLGRILVVLGCDERKLPAAVVLDQVGAEEDARLALEQSE